MKKITDSFLAGSVPEYLQQLPEPVQYTLEKVRDCIKEAAPNAAEKISYRIPTYTYLGPLIYFAAHTNHCALYVLYENIIHLFREELQGYKTNGTAIHFTPEKPLPPELIRKIVIARIKQNEEKHTAKKNQKRKA